LNVGIVVLRQSTTRVTRSTSVEVVSPATTFALPSHVIGANPLMPSRGAHRRVVALSEQHALRFRVGLEQLVDAEPSAIAGVRALRTSSTAQHA
jgi:hypothetical protein